jgi:predicted ATPase/signal transduction histidine kinase
MTDVSRYTITETLSSAHGTVVCRAVRNADRFPVVLKLLDPSQHGPKDIQRLRREYEIGQSLDSRAVVKPLQLETYEGMPALAMEDFGGRPLADLLGKPLDVARFLDLAIGIAEGVADLHRRGIIHGDLKPENIVVNPVTGQVKVMDLGLASRLPREATAAQPPQLIEGSLPYMSPEQTGRVNRSVDNRSDLYSLGVTFYQMLTGRLPFHARDPLEWIHCHVARAPPSPCDVVPTVPEPIARIVKKLLAKMGDGRYQTAHGLRRDLACCAEQWRRTGRIEPFPLGEHDVPDQLMVPQKLYGRERELGELLATLGRVVATGKSELLLVSGPSGVGKSSLVRELREPALRCHGVFLSGKFDQHVQNIPYSTIVQACGQLVLDLLAQDEEDRRRRTKEVQRALGNRGQLIVDMIPPLALLLGEQPPVAELPIADEERRFRRVLLDFLGALAGPDHPLVLFLDDLQWADVASLRLIEAILAAPEIHCLLLVGAYREAEVTPSHPLTSIVDRARQSGASATELGLTPLSLEALSALVADTLRATSERIRPLAHLVHAKTGGNPFFAIQFLSALHHERILRLDDEGSTWLWDIGRIEQMEYTDNVVDLMVRRLGGLPSATRAVLQGAACVGSKSPSWILALMQGLSEEELLANIWDALREGLIIRSADGYVFAHDRVRQAAYSLIPDSRRPALHLAIGRLLLANTPREQLGERTFEVATQLDRGVDLITDPEERAGLADLNLKAARKARAAGAYSSAVQYVSKGIALLPAKAWEVAYELSYGLHFERVRSEWLGGQNDAAARALGELRRHAMGRVHQAEVCRLEIELCEATGEVERGARIAREAMSTLFGVDLPAHPTDATLREALEATWEELGSRAIEDLLHLPDMTDPEARAAVGLISTSLPPAYFTDVNLHDLMCCKIVSLSNRLGNTECSPHGYVTFGAALGRRLERWDDARRLGDVALRIIEHGGPVAGWGKSSAYFTIGDFIQFWTRPLAEVTPFFYKSLDSGVEYGDINTACYAAHMIVECRWLAGDDLADVAADVEVRMAFVRRSKYHAICDWISALRGLIQTLRGSRGPAPADDQGTCDAPVDSHPLRPFVRTMGRLVADYLFGDFASAAAAAREAAESAHTVTAQVSVADYEYFSALAVAAHHADLPPGEREPGFDRVRSCLETHRVWQKHCPVTFGHRWALIAAELARMEGRIEDAMRLYEQAVESARRNGFVQNEGIACECAARFYRARGLATFADSYLLRARSCYGRWGADAKVERLDRLHPFLHRGGAQAPTATFAASAEQLDLLSVVKASQAISRERLLDDVLRTLLRVVLEQGGAQRGVLVLQRDGELLVEAQAAIEDGGFVTSVLQAIPIQNCPMLPGSVLRYVARTKSPVMLDEEAGGTGRFASDPYLASAKPRSALCLPIVKQAEAIGLLYLENRAAGGAFTPQRMAALGLLATQAAISLESAQLLAAEQAARAAAERAEQRAALLAEAGTVLSEALDYESRLRALARLCVRRLADWCVIDLLEDGRIRRAAGAHADPAKERVLRCMSERYPPSRSSPHPVAMVVRSGEPLLLREISDETLRDITENEDHAKLARELGACSAIVVPLVAREQTFGWLNLSSGTPRRYGSSDLDLALDLARRAAIHVDNARLYRASQEAVRVRDDFLTVASHELFTPITSLRLSLQALARKRGGDAELSTLITLAARQGDRLQTLVGDLLEVTCLEKEGLSLELAPVALLGVVRDVLRAYGADLARARCEVSLHGDDVTGLWDRRRLEQLVKNLVSNAVKFGTGRPIEITVVQRDGLARLVVADHGAGVDPARLPHIFERFERAASVRHYGGLGLGLYICRRIVEAQGGSIRADSEPGIGTTLTVELPCTRSPG